MFVTQKTTAMGLVAVLGLIAGWLIQPTRRAEAQVLTGEPITSIPASRFFTPRSYDADGIEELIQRVARFGGVAHLPAATYRINRTIRIEGVGPLRIEGESAGDPFDPEKSGYKCRPTRLLWTGPQGGTMLHINDSNGPGFSNILFDGGARAGTLVQLNARPGWATGNLRFERVSFCNADIGIQCGTDEKEVNCADLVLDEVAMVRLKTGLRVNNEQSVNHHIRTLGFYRVGTVLDFERGGNATVVGWGGSAFDLFMRVGKAGPFNGTFLLAGGRPEMVGISKRYARLLETSDQLDTCDVTFQSTQETGGDFDDKLEHNDADPAFVLTKGATLTVQNHAHYRPFVSMNGGVARSVNGRWHFDPNMPAAVKATGGDVAIESPRDLKGKRFNELRQGSE